MSETEELVRADFAAFLNDQAGAFVYGMMGLRLIRERCQAMLHDADPDKSLLVGDGRPTASSTVGFQRWKIGDIPDHLGEEGVAATAFGRQWLVSIYAHWEHHFRGRFASALAIQKSELKVPVIGDLRLMRHDILHCRGVASEDNTGRCTELSWFEPGDEIHIRRVHVTECMQKLGQTFRL